MPRQTIQNSVLVLVSLLFIACGSDQGSSSGEFVPRESPPEQESSSVLLDTPDDTSQHRPSDSKRAPQTSETDFEEFWAMVSPTKISKESIFPAYMRALRNGRYDHLAGFMTKRNEPLTVSDVAGLDDSPVKSQRAFAELCSKVAPNSQLRVVRTAVDESGKPLTVFRGIKFGVSNEDADGVKSLNEVQEGRCEVAWLEFDPDTINGVAGKSTWVFLDFNSEDGSLPIPSFLAQVWAEIFESMRPTTPEECILASLINKPLFDFPWWKYETILVGNDNFTLTSCEDRRLHTTWRGMHLKNSALPLSMRKQALRWLSDFHTFAEPDQVKLVEYKGNLFFEEDIQTLTSYEKKVGYAGEFLPATGPGPTLAELRTLYRTIYDSLD